LVEAIDLNRHGGSVNRRYHPAATEPCHRRELRQVSSRDCGSVENQLDSYQCSCEHIAW
jgi:hypothetical protein